MPTSEGAVERAVGLGGEGWSARALG